MRDDFKRVRERPAPAVLALLIATLVGLFAGLALGDDGSVDDPKSLTFSVGSSSATEVTGTVPAETTAERAALLEATTRGVAIAERSGDRAAAVVWPTGWKQPVVVAGHAPASGQMWSLSKPVTAIAAYDAAVGQAANGLPSKGLRQGIKDSIRRSDNCGQRRVALGLQELYGGIQAKAIKAFADVLGEAGATVETGAIQRKQDSAESSDCTRYITEVAPLESVKSTDPAVQFGTTEWTSLQAATFAHALASGTYGPAGEYVLDLMGQSKLKPRPDTNKDPLVPKDLNWGAGNAFVAWKAAYKSGWGGKREQNFAATQIVVLRGVKPSVALAAVVYPKAPVADEDPEKTTAPEDLTDIFTQIRIQMEGWISKQ
ncbi:MAG: hypothetical protein ACRDKE_04220 [Solirubrobacterales bacterium]